jgi:hypothetical protein
MGTRLGRQLAMSTEDDALVLLDAFMDASDAEPPR